LKEEEEAELRKRERVNQFGLIYPPIFVIPSMISLYLKGEYLLSICWWKKPSPGLVCCESSSARI